MIMLAEEMNHGTCLLVVLAEKENKETFSDSWLGALYHFLLAEWFNFLCILF